MSLLALGMALAHGLFLAAQLHRPAAAPQALWATPAPAPVLVLDVSSAEGEASGRAGARVGSVGDGSWMSRADGLFPEASLGRRSSQDASAEVFSFKDLSVNTLSSEALAVDEFSFQDRSVEGVSPEEFSFIQAAVGRLAGRLFSPSPAAPPPPAATHAPPPRPALLSPTLSPPPAGLPLPLDWRASTCFFLAALLSGFCFGSIWPHLVVLASEIFGSSNLPANYMFFDGGCGASGTILLANLLPRVFHSPEGNCDARCFASTHAAIAGFCLVGSAAAAAVAVSSAHLYWKIGASREAVRLRRRIRLGLVQGGAAEGMDEHPLSPWEVRADGAGSINSDGGGAILGGADGAAGRGSEQGGGDLRVARTYVYVAPRVVG